VRSVISPLLLVAALLVAGTARAAFIDFGASALHGNTVTVGDLGPGRLAIDPHFAANTSIDLAIVLEPEDAGALAWNALVDNLTGEVWKAFFIGLDGARLAHAGSITANAGVVMGMDLIEETAVITFDPAEAAGIDLGAPFGAGEDWVVDAGGATTFQLSFAPYAVPEPASIFAIGFGLAAIAAGRRAP
jgi:hypothetical protein